MKHLSIKLGFLSFAIKAKLAVALLLLTSTTMGQAAPEVGEPGTRFHPSGFRRKRILPVRLQR